MKVDRIVIVGGGSAGWMSAAILSKSFPEKEITLIESPDVPIIGVGESTTAGIQRFMKYLDNRDDEFMPLTNATYKASIKFSGFNTKENFHYPFGYAEKTTGNELFDWGLVKQQFDLPVTDYVDTHFPMSALFNQNKMNMNFLDVERFPWMAYHFDAIKFGLYLREYKCKDVEHIQSEVVGIAQDESGIASLTLDNGQVITADLFVDCTGFKSMLLGETLEEEFKSYADVLPNNKAWAVQIPYKDKRSEMRPYTNCTALGNGWAWHIGVWDRLGNGYVFSDKYVSDEDALEEFKLYLMSDKMSIPRSREEVDSYNYRLVPFKVGVYNRTWVKNVVGIGLSAAFLEPLESNGLQFVHESLFYLIDTLDRGNVNRIDKDMYNERTYQYFNEFAKFIALHYAVSDKRDTKYWKDIQEREYEFHPDISVGLLDTYTFPDIDAGSVFILLGNGYNFAGTVASKIQKEFYDNKDHTKLYGSLQMRKILWENEAEKCLLHYDYLEQKIYGLDYNA